MKKISFSVAAVLADFLLFTSESFACACCAERGEYVISTRAPGTSEIELLGQMKFDDTTDFYTGSGDFENIKGLDSIRTGYEASVSNFFTLENMFTAKTFKLNFKTADGKTGMLLLPMPAQMVNFRADIHDTPESKEVSLYKEWRFKGTVGSGNGFFKTSILKPTTYFLVLQGRGNNCDNAADFTNWRLEVTGKNADYTFIGKLKSDN